MAKRSINIVLMVFPKYYFSWQPKVHAFNIIQYFFTRSLFSENAIHGYACDVSKVNLGKNGKTKYFNFIIQIEEDVYNCVNFSPRKRRPPSQYI